MAEPTEQRGSHIAISPAVPALARSWPDPRDTRDVLWRAAHARDSLTAEDIRWLAQRASAYTHIFELTQQQFLPTHSAIRAHLRDKAVPAGRPTAQGARREVVADPAQFEPPDEHARARIRAAIEERSARA